MGKLGTILMRLHIQNLLPFGMIMDKRNYVSLTSQVQPIRQHWILLMQKAYTTCSGKIIWMNDITFRTR